MVINERRARADLLRRLILILLAGEHNEGGGRESWGWALLIVKPPDNTEEGDDDCRRRRRFAPSMARPSPEAGELLEVQGQRRRISAAGASGTEAIVRL